MSYFWVYFTLFVDVYEHTAPFLLYVTNNAVPSCRDKVVVFLNQLTCAIGHKIHPDPIVVMQHPCLYI